MIISLQVLGNEHAAIQCTQPNLKCKEVHSNAVYIWAHTYLCCRCCRLVLCPKEAMSQSGKENWHILWATGGIYDNYGQRITGASIWSQEQFLFCNVHHVCSFLWGLFCMFIGFIHSISHSVVAVRKTHDENAHTCIESAWTSWDELNELKRVEMRFLWKHGTETKGKN